MQTGRRMFWSYVAIVGIVIIAGLSWWLTKSMPIWQKSLIISLVVFVGIAEGLAAWSKERNPVITVECSPVLNGDPACLECEVRNSGRGEARDVYVGFNNILPLETKLLAGAEIGAELVEAYPLPSPNLPPSAALLTPTFSIHIPRVAPGAAITFQVRTINEDNRRAARQVLHIRGEILKILEAFGERLSKAHPENAQYWNLEAVVSARTKQENFFTPGKVSYEAGSFSITYLTDEEQVARAVNQDLYARYKKEFIDIYQGGTEFKAPVVRIVGPKGARTLSLHPPYVTTYITGEAPWKDLTEQGSALVYPQVPDKYDYE